MIKLQELIEKISKQYSDKSKEKDEKTGSIRNGSMYCTGILFL